MLIAVIPIYTTKLNDYERYSLRQCLNIFSPRRKIAFVMPESLDLSPLAELFGNIEIKEERFADSFFKSIKDYNRLMLSSEFYERFIEYEYLLICQTDVLVLKDTLDEWCEKGYDYVGAPWLPKYKYISYPKRLIWYYRRLISKLSKDKDHGVLREEKVGNGGFSLRNTKVMMKTCVTLQHVIVTYKENGDSVKYFEDVFWGTIANSHGANLKIPNYKEAVMFALETRPDCGMRLTGGQLPMAIHAWYKPLYLEFWKNKLKLTFPLDGKANR